MSKVPGKRKTVKQRAREYERKMRQLERQLREDQKRARREKSSIRAQIAAERKKLADEKKRINKAMRAEKERARHLTFKELVRQGIDGAPIKALLSKLPARFREKATSEIIQGRLDRAAEVYDDVRIEAWEIAEDLDWDISEVFDAWNYDESQA